MPPLNIETTQQAYPGGPAKRSISSYQPKEDLMHRSRLSTFVIDCKTHELDAATAFWSSALGRQVSRSPDNDPMYRVLRSRSSEPLLLTQAVEHESRIHLDIETDDQEAEVRRLEALGAKR